MGRMLRLAALLLYAATLAQAEGWSIVGRVTDAKTGEPLGMANVVLKELQLEAQTDENGRYLILNVPAGKYTIEASYIRYVGRKAKVIVKNDGAITHADLRLQACVCVVCNLIQTPRPSHRRYTHFQLGRASTGWPSFGAGNTGTTGWTTGWNGKRLEVGACAWGRGLTWNMGYLLGFKLAEWYDEGDTRDGLPAILPVYLYLAGVPPHFALTSCQTNVFGYVMGTISASVGAGIGIHWEWRDVMPGVELNWTHSWRGSNHHSRITLNLGVGIGFWHRSQPGYL